MKASSLSTGLLRRDFEAPGQAAWQNMCNEASEALRSACEYRAVAQTEGYADDIESVIEGQLA